MIFLNYLHSVNKSWHAALMYVTCHAINQMNVHRVIKRANRLVFVVIGMPSVIATIVNGIAISCAIGHSNVVNINARKSATSMTMNFACAHLVCRDHVLAARSQHKHHALWKSTHAAIHAKRR